MVKKSIINRTKCHRSILHQNENKIDQLKLHKTASEYGLEVIKLEFILKLKIKRNDWLLADT